MTIKIEYETTPNVWVEAKQAVWLSMTHLMGSAQTVRVAVTGGNGCGHTFRLGTDNAVCTVNGLMPYTTAGTAELGKLQCAHVRLTDTVEGTHTGTSEINVGTQGNRAWIAFTLTFTED